ncbi:MAG: hypothetical protein RJA70_4351 [Pseudomonadota bacterium]|jgi:uncharacterized protein (DUF924 family)
MSPAQVLDEWFGVLDSLGSAPPEKQKRWFSKDADFDQYLAAVFGEAVQKAAGGELDWDHRPDSNLARIILLDQFTRNIYRGSPQMYAADAIARGLTQQLIQSGADQHFPLAHRTFTYMPLMHSESLRDQEACVRCFEECLASAPEETKAPLAFNLKYAKDHLNIVARFGRFPHRNAILGRESTAEELDFLN